MLYDAQESPVAYFDNYLQLSQYTGRSCGALQSSISKGENLRLDGRKHIVKKVKLDDEKGG